MYFSSTQNSSYSVLNSINDFYYSISPFGSYDVKILTEKANNYNIQIADVIDYTLDNFSKDEVFNESGASINYFFLSLYTLRINQLQEYTKEAVDEVDYILNNDFSCVDETEHTEGYYQTQNTLSTLEKLSRFLENEASDKIHLNACCSCFDSNILDELDDVQNADDVIDAVNQGRIYIPSN
jgi:hypothetical protein